MLTAEWTSAAALIFSVTVLPMGSLLLWLHDLNRRARESDDVRRSAEEKRQEKRHNKHVKGMNRRLDHLDKCVDDVKDGVGHVSERVTRIEAQGERRRAVDRPAAAIAAALCLLALPALAHDGDSAEAMWYRSLKQNDSGVSCCSEQDCSPTDAAKMLGNAYWVPISDGWQEVPPERIIRRDNPVGRAVLCRSPVSGMILCFVAGSEG